MKRFDEQTCYEMLGVDSAAEPQEIIAAYTRARNLYRADSLPLYTLLDGAQLDAVRRAVESAYRTLSDELTRAEYDRSLIASGMLSPDAARKPSAPRSSPAPPIAPSAEEEPEQAARSTSESASAEAEQDPQESETAPPPVHEEEEEEAEREAPLQGGVIEPAPMPAALLPPLPPPFEEKEKEKIPPAAFDGRGLRAFRESRGISLDTIARETKISAGKWRDIEENRYSQLPARVYLKGFLKEDARILGLDPDAVSEDYLRRIAP